MSNEYPPADSGQEPEQPPRSEGSPYGPPPQGGQPPYGPAAAGRPAAVRPPPQGGQPPYGQPPQYPPGEPQGGSYGQTYGPPGPGYLPAPPQQRTSPMAIVSLVLGIVGICCAQTFALSLAALATGFVARKHIARSHGAFKGEGMALAGLVLGALGVLIGIVYWILIATGAIDTNFYLRNS